MTDRFTLRLTRYGAWELEGVHSGRLELLRGDGRVLAFKEHGRHVYSGQGRPQRYAPATYRVFEVLDGSVQDGRCEIRQLTRWLCRATPGVADPYLP